MDNKINELGYKNHDPFFYNLNKNFQGLMDSVATARRDICAIEDLYINIDTFFIFYSSYIKNDKEVIEELLNNLRDFVYSEEYNKMIKTRKTTKEAYSRASELLLNTRDIIPYIMAELHNKQLFPQTIEIDKDIPSAVRNSK